MGGVGLMALGLTGGPVVSGQTAQRTTGTRLLHGPRPVRLPRLPHGRLGNETRGPAVKPLTPLDIAWIQAGTPKAPAAAGQLASAQAQPAQPPQPPGLDSTALANIANNQFQTGNQINALNQQSGYAKTDLQTALQKLGQQQPLQEQADREKYNQQGLLYSGHLGQSLGQIGQSFADRQSALQTNFTRGQAGRDSRIAALKAGEPLYAEGQSAASAARAAAAASADTTLGAGATDTGPTDAQISQWLTVGSRGKPAAKQTFRTLPGRGGVWHVYPGGRRVFVRK